ncbi:MAG: alkaline shock response membrane anchor protein AmaP [Candidatus Omnitrophica bacterium]|nr:alkaline shock response membrane anchor protein AmaP [Candidatus Omnitrophota bacterium]
MKIFSRLAVRVYVLLVIGISCLLILATLDLIDISYEQVKGLLYNIFYDGQTRIAVASTAVIALVINYLFMRSILGGGERGRTIAFDNPAGRVSVSLTALEDMTRRVVLRVPEVKEVRSAIKAGKNKVLEIDVRIVLKGDINIPEMTSSLQDLVKHKVEDTIGIEKSPVVRVHVSKIFPKDTKIKKQKESEELGPEEEANIPFQGYRA